VSAVETQPERTALSWQRLGLSVLGVAGLVAHGALLDRRGALLAASGVLAGLALVVLAVVVPRRYRRIREAVRSGTAVSAPGLALLATGIVVAVAATAVATVLSAR
jgi:putative membrane protein